VIAGRLGNRRWVYGALVACGAPVVSPALPVGRSSIRFLPDGKVAVVDDGRVVVDQDLRAPLGTVVTGLVGRPDSSVCTLERCQNCPLIVAAAVLPGGELD
jgi:hypothetical protein